MNFCNFDSLHILNAQSRYLRRKLWTIINNFYNVNATTFVWIKIITQQIQLGQSIPTLDGDLFNTKIPTRITVNWISVKKILNQVHRRSIRIWKFSNFCVYRRILCTKNSLLIFTQTNLKQNNHSSFIAMIFFITDETIWGL